MMKNDEYGNEYIQKSIYLLMKKYVLAKKISDHKVVWKRFHMDYF